MTENAETYIKALYESVGRGFESLPSHKKENREYNVLSVFFFVRWKGLEQGGGA